MERDFEVVYKDMQPLIYFILKKLNIYKDHEYYIQTANIALWMAWKNFDAQKGKFSTYAFSSIRGALLTELSKTNKDAERFVATNDFALNKLIHDQIDDKDHYEDLHIRYDTICRHVTDIELAILHAYYIENYSMQEIAKMVGQSEAALQKRKWRIVKRLRTIFN
ncbi:sigma-70 family RNA polymerase sigma factor [Kurthia sibirica]|uniref:RNA polymerase sigma-70 region 2 domain-containing protein n=1 Tax=Kurthia sibirica TaxID=202750 RepID=A0A2U3AEP2_9BACL|nr:sigma-70 family RNA polymerase sigma factor [Kurthia sibirica]PWI23028.1 hypothetical protein DEX24_16485 [Kurthia sibirica]GEK35553.1 hypothetical protein KSI01_30860 [Kurthia sibirica]